MKFSQLAVFEANLQASTKELKLAQANFLKAKERLEKAETGHTEDLLAFANEVNTARNLASVSKLIP